MSSDILTARKGPVLEITLNRPQIGNAASDAMAVELTKLLLGAAESSEIVVLRGAGAPGEGRPALTLAEVSGRVAPAG